MKLAYSNIINLNFDEALLILESQKNINPDNSFILLNENYIDFLKILIGGIDLTMKNAKTIKILGLVICKKIVWIHHITYIYNLK